MKIRFLVLCVGELIVIKFFTVSRLNPRKVKKTKVTKPVYYRFQDPIGWRTKKGIFIIWEWVAVLEV